MNGLKVIMRPFLFFGAVVAFAASVTFAGEPRFSSSENRTALIELYTSEGCSSCPAAERWLATLRDAPGLWRDFVPVEFHVNYWDRLGWPDRFASREATQREYAHAAAWGGASVYTPCFVRDGVEWHTSNRMLPASVEKAGVLTFTLDAEGKGRAEFSPAPPRAGQTLELQVALLGSGFTSRVTAGENRGETLRHEFVVLALQTHALAPAEAGKNVQRAEFALPRSKLTEIPRQALALWVTRKGELTPLQATGGWLGP